MARVLTYEERSVLAHVVADPDQWWTHASEMPNIVDAEAAIAAKVSRWKADYEAAVAQPGYMTRAERIASGAEDR